VELEEEDFRWSAKPPVGGLNSGDEDERFIKGWGGGGGDRTRDERGS